MGLAVLPRKGKPYMGQSSLEVGQRQMVPVPVTTTTAVSSSAGSKVNENAVFSGSCSDNVVTEPRDANLAPPVPTPRKTKHKDLNPFQRKFADTLENEMNRYCQG